MVSTRTDPASHFLRPPFRASFRKAQLGPQSLPAQFGKLYLLLGQMTEPNEHYAHFTVTGGSMLQGSGGGRLVMRCLEQNPARMPQILRTSRFRGNRTPLPFAKRRTLSYRIESTVHKPHDYDDSKLV